MEQQKFAANAAIGPGAPAGVASEGADPIARPRTRAWRHRAEQLGIAAAIALVVFALGYAWGMKQLPGFDAGPMVDMAWRMAHGLRPNMDFPSPFPPSFALPAKWAFEIAGVRWSSLAMLGAGFGALLSAIVFWVWTPVVGRSRALGLAALAAAQMPLIDGFWWYGSSAGMAVIALAGAVIADHKHAQCAGRPLAHRLSWMILKIALMMFLMGAKPNEAWPMVAGAVVAIGAPKRFAGMGDLRQALGLFFGSFALFAALCQASGFPLINYGDFMAHVAHRAGHFPLFDSHRLPMDRIVAIAALVCASAGFAPLLRDNDRPRAATGFFSLGRGFIVAGLSASLAGAMFLNADCALQSAPLLAAALLMGAPPQSTSRKRAVLVFWMAGMALALWLGHARFRVEEAGVSQFWEEPASLSTIHGGFFDGLSAGPRLRQFMDESKMALEQTESKNVFFGPRVEFGYAAFGLESPDAQPLWWDPKVAYRPRDRESHIALWIKQAPDLMILDNMDITFMPAPIMNYASGHYRLVSMQAIEAAALAPGQSPPSRQEASVLVSDALMERLQARANDPSTPAKK